MKTIINKYIKQAAVILSIAMMTIIAEALGNTEIIIPEFAALLTGGWLVKSQPWRVDNMRLILLMGISAFAGVSVVKYINIPLFLQLLIILIFLAVMLTVSGTAMYPVISAAILPLIMKTDSYIYAFAAVIMAVVIVLVRMFFEKIGLCEKSEFKKQKISIFVSFAKWVAVIAGVSIMACIGINTGNIFFIAPPLVVIYVTLLDEQSSVSENPVMVFIMVMLCSITGALSRVLSVMYGIHATIVAVIAITLVMIFMKKLKFYFPPAAALALLPMIIKSDAVLIYPLQVSAGCVAFILMAEFIRKKVFRMD